MTTEDIIRMAEEAGAIHYWHLSKLERFATLIASAERDKHKWDIHSCSPTCNRYACVATREAVLAEREACAKICVDESWRLKKIAFEHENLQANSAAIRASILAEMIRARGQA